MGTGTLSVHPHILQAKANGHISLLLLHLSGFCILGCCLLMEALFPLAFTSPFVTLLSASAHSGINDGRI